MAEIVFLEHDTYKWQKFWEPMHAILEADPIRVIDEDRLLFDVPYRQARQELSRQGINLACQDNTEYCVDEFATYWICLVYPERLFRSLTKGLYPRFFYETWNQHPPFEREGLIKEACLAQACIAKLQREVIASIREITKERERRYAGKKWPNTQQR